MISLSLELPTFAEIERDQKAAREREESARVSAMKRSFEAARLNRLTRDWTTQNTSTSWELRRDLRVLRARARALARNDDYVKRFLSMVRSNVAGPTGVKLQSRSYLPGATQLDRPMNRAVETAWAAWSHPENCSLAGRLSWAESCRKAIGMVARDGECLVRMVAADNPFGFALKFYAADWLDETYCESLASGNRVVMSVEIDDDDRPVAYWLTPPPSEYLFAGNKDRRRTRVDASEMIHLFLPDDENADDDSQTRGVPWLHTAMKRLKILNGYEEAELIAARIGACKMGFYKQSDVDEYTGEEDKRKAEAYPLMDSAQPGTFGLLEPGMEFEAFTPDHPNSGYQHFLKAVLRGIAAGLDVTYFSLANDLEAVNYSSARIGLLQERDVWRALQDFLSEHFCRPVYLNWLRASMMSGALRISAEDYRRLTEPLWQPRGWKWVDPLKEVQAKTLAIAAGLETRTDAVAEQGADFEDVLDTLASEQAMIAEKGVKLQTDAPAKSPKQLTAKDEEEDAAPGDEEA